MGIDIKGSSSEVVHGNAVVDEGSTGVSEYSDDDDLLPLLLLLLRPPLLESLLSSMPNMESSIVRDDVSRIVSYLSFSMAFNTEKGPLRRAELG